MKKNEQFFVPNYFRAPGHAIDRLQFFKLFLGEVQTLPLDVFVVGSPADWSLLALGAAMDAVHDPVAGFHGVGGGFFPRARSAR